MLLRYETCGRPTDVDVRDKLYGNLHTLVKESETLCIRLTNVARGEKHYLEGLQMLVDGREHYMCWRYRC